MHTEDAESAGFSESSQAGSAARTRGRSARGAASALALLAPLGLMLAVLVGVVVVAHQMIPESETGWLQQRGVSVPDRAGLLAIGGLGAAVWLFACWALRDRVGALLRIRGSILAFAAGEKDASALVISPSSPVGRGWNGLLAWREAEAEEAVISSVRSSASGGGESGDERYCDALWQGVVVVDDQLVVRYANGAGAILLRTKRDTLLGSDARKIFIEPEVLEAIRDAAERGSRQRQVIDVGDPTVPESSVLRFSVRATGRENARRVMIVIEDVTQQRIAEEVQHAFVAQAAHELRTPLTNIRLYIEQLIDDDLDPEARGTALNVLNQETGRLDRIVSDMLSISEIESGGLNVQVGDVKIASLLSSLEADYAAIAKEKRLTLTFDLPPKFPQVSGDREKIDLVLHNLLGNAVKYTPDGGAVRVVVREGDGRLLIDFVDTGIGVAEADRERIFERFVRASDSRISQIAGTGLGLALARDIARMHGGDVVLQSELDVGSTFGFWLPISAGTGAVAA